MKTKNINKDLGDLEKINLDSFLRIRKKSVIQFINENNIDSLEDFYLFIVNNFNCSSSLYEEVKNYFNSSNKQSSNTMDTYPIDDPQISDTPSAKPRKAKKSPS